MACKVTCYFRLFSSVLVSVLRTSINVLSKSKSRNYVTWIANLTKLFLSVLLSTIYTNNEKMEKKQLIFSISRKINYLMCKSSFLGTSLCAWRKMLYIGRRKNIYKTSFWGWKNADSFYINSIKLLLPCDNLWKHLPLFVNMLWII